ncbi:1,3-beta-galactosyl-N-acetylhexosamine phosphorylase [Cellulomonas sp. NPDC089187]|uniref:1,3-beta-galactosyl-N-acetylhexosamine phosphorylase n=1 Tax=Cellulomonas sp. NPDC089187 TaxID=3154970 RepID=UPI003412B072
MPENSRTGRVTIPTQQGFAEETLRIARLWGADAVRNSDGTELERIDGLEASIYHTYFPARGHNEFIGPRPRLRPQMFLLSDRAVAEGGPLRIRPLAGYSTDQLELNLDDDPRRFWEVVDRTTGELVAEWSVDGDAVVIPEPVRWHEYTVSFLAYVAWDPVEMYNHLTNNWGDRERDIPLDIVHPECRAFTVEAYTAWLAEHPEVDVVRFTTFFYQFSLVFDDRDREKFVDWFGYGASVSPAMLDEFERRKGYRLRAEDFVDQGYANSTFRPPSQAYRDYIDVVGAVVTEAAEPLVRATQAAGKQAMMFLGDQWIGTEPYGERFAGLGMDAVVGSVGDGTTLRMIADIPGVWYTEGRFLPYFFPDTFRPGGDPAGEARQNWLQARRAILRRPIDRMGYGGYLSLAADFPDFVDEVAGITDQFRELHEHIAGTRPYSGLRVGVLNAWGRLRSWQAFTVAHALPYPRSSSYYGVLEALSGMSVDVEFLDFDSVTAHGVPEGIDVLVLAGAADTAFSGGDVWRGELTPVLRGWVRSGGGIIGIGEPSATAHQGRFFQLADCLGVDRERGWGQSTDCYWPQSTTEHPIIADLIDPLDTGDPVPGVQPISEDVQVLAATDHSVRAAAYRAGQGRSVYLAGLPYSTQNTRLLLRALHWAAGQEDVLGIWSAAHPDCEVHAYPQSGWWCLTNGSTQERTTTVRLGDGSTVTRTVPPGGIAWEPIR